MEILSTTASEVKKLDGDIVNLCNEYPYVVKYKKFYNSITYIHSPFANCQLASIGSFVTFLNWYEDNREVILKDILTAITKSLGLDLKRQLIVNVKLDCVESIKRDFHVISYQIYTSSNNTKMCNIVLSL